ncbi:MAG: type II toxin-antitoxin system VapC family toxin [Thermoanaerobaculia bacterium]
MIVVDSSAVIDLILIGRTSRFADRLLDARESLHAPHLIDLEVAQVLRRLVRVGAFTVDRAGRALDYFLNLPISRHPHSHLLPRIWQLRNNLTAYDAAYVSLAEALHAPLLTLDARLARARGHTAVVELA